MASIDAFWARLGIRDPLDQSTCIGYAQRKPTCGCAVAIASRQQALSLLRDTYDDILGGHRINEYDLQSAAGLLHCKRWHQYQAADKVSDWKQRLRNWKPERPARSSIPSYSSGDSSGRTPNGNVQLDRESLKSVNNKDLLREIERRASSSRYPSFQRRLVELFDELFNDQFQSDVEDYDSDAEHVSGVVEEFESDRGDGRRTRTTGRRMIQGGSGLQNVRTRVEPTQAQPTQLAITASIDTSVSTTTVARRHPSTALVQQSRINTNSTSTPTISPSTSSAALVSTSTASTPRPSTPSTAAPSALTSSSPTPTATTPIASATASSTSLSTPAPSSSPLRHSHETCYICLTGYNNSSSSGNEEQYWECGTCQNRVHQECFERWENSLASSVPVRCIYCRTNVRRQH